MKDVSKEIKLTNFAPEEVTIKPGLNEFKIVETSSPGMHIASIAFKMIDRTNLNKDYKILEIYPTQEDYRTFAFSCYSKEATDFKMLIGGIPSM